VEYQTIYMFIKKRYILIEGEAIQHARIQPPH